MKRIITFTLSAICLLFAVAAQADANYSFHWWLDFETGSDEDYFTTTVATNSVGNYVAPLGREVYMPLTETTNIFRISTDYSFNLTNSFKWAGAVESDTGTRCLRMRMDTGGGEYTKWFFGQGVTNASLGFYFQTDLASQSPSEGYFDVLYVERQWSADGNHVAAALFHNTDSPYWTAHANSNNVTVTGPGVYGMDLHALQWVTMQVTPTNLTVAVYDPATQTQIGTNSIQGMGTSVNSILALRLLAWRRGIPQVGKSTWIDNVVVNTNGDFPLLPWGFVTEQTFTWPTNTMTSLGYTEVSNAVYHATNGCTIILPTGTTNWDASLIVSNKAISLLGAGPALTIITNTQTGATELGEKETVIIYATTNGVTRVAQIGFDANRTNNLVLVHAVAGNYFAPFHIHSCEFMRSPWTALSWKAMLAGLVEYCTFRNNDLPLTSYADDHPTTSWETALTLGTTNAVYTEHCAFLNDEAFIDGSGIGVVTARGRGSRDVFRFNALTNTYAQKFLPIVDVHGNVDSSSRGTVQFECYGNTFVSDASDDQKLTDLRGGTVCLFSNVFLGSTMRSQFTAREEDGNFPAWATYTTTPPGYDKNLLYLWQNTSQGSAVTSLELFYEATDPVFFVENTDVFWSAKPAYTPLGEHPLTAFPATPTPPTGAASIGTLRAVNLIQRSQ